MVFSTTSGDYDFHKTDLHCGRQLSCISEFFWPIGSWKAIFKWLHCNFVIIFPLKRTWPLIWTALNSL
jgi:hypothetical protein